MAKKISLPLLFTAKKSCLLLLFFFLTMASAESQNQVQDTRLPPILPGQAVGSQVVITTAGPVVGHDDMLPRVPTARETEQKLPSGLVVDTRRDFLDAAKQGSEAVGDKNGNSVVSQPKSDEFYVGIPLPLPPIEPEVK
jgi:hypothetical protein